MGQPTRSRRRIVADSSDAEESSTQQTKLKSTRQPERKVNSRTGSRAKPSASPSSKTATVAHRNNSLSNDAKSAARPIYSFFNAATQRQTTPVTSLSADPVGRQPAVESALEETILDFSDDDGLFDDLMSTASGTSSSLRKRGRTPTNDSKDESSAQSKPSLKFRKIAGSNKSTPLVIRNEDTRTWTERFPPCDLSELAVHKRKVDDVRRWLETAFNGRRQRILVLKGPAGVGKTTTLHLLAKDLAADILQWQNPAGGEFAVEVTGSASSQFEEFLFRSGHGNGLDLASSENTASIVATVPDKKYAPATKRLVLIEEFPNTYSKTSPALLAFRSTLTQYLSQSPAVQGGVVPVVIVISETLLSTSTAAADSFTAHRLLGPDLSLNPYLDSIEFNPVAPTILLKALQLTVVKEARKSGRRYTPGSSILKRLAEAGDVRSAISSLEFLCLRGDGADIWSGKILFTKPKKAISDAPLTQTEMDAMELISSRETSMSIFHAVGRVVYNNRVEPPAAEPVPQPSSWMAEHSRKKVPEKSPDILMDEIGTDPATFIAALHENHLPSCWTSDAGTDLQIAENCADDFSDSDLLSMDRFSSANRMHTSSHFDGLRQDEIAFNAAVRGLLFHLPHPVNRSNSTHGRKGDAFRMFYPKSLRLWKMIEENESATSILVRRAQQDAILPAVVSEQGADDEPRLSALGLTKHEMLLERLPYMARIMASKTLTFGQGQTLEQIQKVTHIAGAAAIDDNIDTGMEDEEEHGSAEPWSTDGPGNDSVTDKAPTLRNMFKSTGRIATETEGEGLFVPVEHSIDKLVLEEDDIED